MYVDSFKKHRSQTASYNASLLAHSVIVVLFGHVSDMHQQDDYLPPMCHDFYIRVVVLIIFVSIN